MPYIGNPIYQSAFVTDQFSGDGTTTAFTMSVAPAGTTNVLVVVSGVVQDPSTYGVVGTTLNFSAAPPSGTGNISCRYLGVPVTGVTTTAYRTVTEFTATASQTTFTPPSYNVGFINVYLNGVLLGSADYTATNGTTVVLATGASAGNLVTVESFRIESVANAIANAAGSVSNTNLTTASITSDKFASTTGSGAVVLATSPTLVTPALGTPSAINLTNATGLSWGALPTGSVLQVVNGSTITGANTSSSSYSNTNLTATITPKYSTSKILVLVNQCGCYKDGNANQGGSLIILRDATTLATIGERFAGDNPSGSVFSIGSISSCYLDSPATTSATTYKTQFSSISNVGTIYVQVYSAMSTITLMEIAA